MVSQEACAVQPDKAGFVQWRIAGRSITLKDRRTRRFRSRQDRRRIVEATRSNVRDLEIARGV